MARFIEMNDDLHDYVLAHANPSHDEVADRLAARTQDRFPDIAGMNIGVDQGRFLATLAHLARARTAVEVGTFTGMSALWIARGLHSDGRLICFDITDEYLELAREAWEEAGVADRIEVRIGPGAEGLAALPDVAHIDLAFVDADKPGYRTYLDLLLPRLAHHGVIAFDNVIWNGAVTDPSDTSELTEAIRDFNDHVASRDDIEAVMLPVGDGVTLIRHRS